MSRNLDENLDLAPSFGIRTFSQIDLSGTFSPLGKLLPFYTV